MIEFASNVASTLIGTIFGAIFAYWLMQIQIRSENSQKRLDMALDFYSELTSVDFTSARSKAGNIFREHSAVIDLDDLRRILPQEQWQDIVMVLSFFRRLQLAIQCNNIDEQMAGELFLGEFLWWYCRWLDAKTPSTWDTRPSIDNLNSWFKKNRTDYEEKKKKALEGN